MIELYLDPNDTPESQKTIHLARIVVMPSFLNPNSKNNSIGPEMDICNALLDDVNQNSNWAIKNDNSSDDDLSDEDDNDNDNEQEKSFLPLESELNVFDPLEFLGIDDERKNSTDDEKYSDFN